MPPEPPPQSGITFDIADAMQSYVVDGRDQDILDLLDIIQELRDNECLERVDNMIRSMRAAVEARKATI